MESDIAIVGAGPVGSLAAIQARKNNVEVAIFEQRMKIGVPDHCAGLLSSTGLKKIGIHHLPKSVIQNDKIIGSRFYSPNGTQFQVKRNEAQAVVVDRSLFDQHLAYLAEQSGATISRNNKVYSVHYDETKKTTILSVKDKTALKRSYKTIESKVTILSEGRVGLLAKQIGFKPPQKKFRLSGYQCLVENVADLNPQFVEMYFSNKISPGFFTWIIPISETTAKVGLATKELGAVQRLQYFMKKYPLTNHRFKKAKISKSFGGEVIVNGLMNKTSSNGVLVAGDAAGQTKATTGGGVITGGLAGIIAGQVAAEAIVEKSYGRTFLKTYDKQWQALLKTQLKAMSLFRWLLNRLSDEAFDLAFETAIVNELDKMIEEKGDIDSQAEIILSLLKDPAVIKLIFRLLPKIQF